MMVTSLVFFVEQTATLLSMYFSHPIVSQVVSFLIKDDGIEFPVITLCNFNAIKKSYIKSEKALEAYKAKHPNFTLNGFFMDAGLDCQESMMICSFGGRQFDCCQYMSVIITSLGKCFK
ncbi:hypothetical protein ANCCAN_09938 [Ancylostoma caninum]|uniref:Uncharacterized protein n=1 Tax=Ancylostoma caninum TaxID=29170 RepID=A0A368GM75_ANCCA|nr:hypothetical protein ANCCAN_09938 [Ancylostoma caninum]